MLSRDLSAVANCLVFHSCREVGRCSSSLHATALLILDSELVSADMRYSLFSFDFRVDILRFFCIFIVSSYSPGVVKFLLYGT